MKIAPVSADLLIKLGLAAVAVVAVVYVVRKSTGAVQGAIDSITSLPSRAWTGVSAYAKDGGSAFLDQYSVNPAPTIGNGSGYGGKYNGPLVNDQGYDFGALSG
jgi:hypothetical protein